MRSCCWPERRCGHFRRQLQPEAKVRLQPCRGQLLQLRNQLQVKAAAIALIGGRGAAIAIAQHPITSGQGWLQAGLNMLGAIGRVEQQLSAGGRGLLLRWMQQQLPQGLAKAVPPGSRVVISWAPAGISPLSGNQSARALSCVVLPQPSILQHQKATPHAGVRSSKALATTVIELSAINRAATGGVSKRPKPGSSTPAAKGNTSRL